METMLIGAGAALLAYIVFWSSAGGPWVPRWFQPYGVFAIACCLGILAVAVEFVNSFITEDQELALIFGAALTAVVMRWIIRYFIYDLRPKYGVMLTDHLLGTLRELTAEIDGPGIHPKSPTEYAKPEHFFTMEEFKTDEKTEDFPSRNAKMKTKFSARMFRIAGQLVKQLGVDQKIMKQAILDKMSSELSEKIKLHTAADLEGTSDTPAGDLELYLMRDGSELCRLGDKYGLKIEPIISDMDPDNKSQEAQAQKRVMELVGDTAKDLQKKLKLKNPEDALEATLVVGGHIKKTVEERGVRKGAKDEQVLEVLTRIGQALSPGRGGDTSTGPGKKKKGGTP